MKEIFLTTVLLAFTQIEASIYYDCGSKEGTLQSVEISGCDQDSMSWCPLKRGTDVQLKISFKSTNAASQVESVVHGILGIVSIPFNLPNSNGCINSGLTCPLKPDTVYVYNATLPVLNIYPQISLKVQWELQDENGNDIICFKIPTRIS